MKILTIKREKFIDWYFNTGPDQDQDSSRRELGNRVIEELLEHNVSAITTEMIFEECEHSIIPLHLVDGFSAKDRLIEVGEVFDHGQYRLELT